MEREEKERREKGSERIKCKRRKFGETSTVEEDDQRQRKREGERERVDRD